MNSGKVFMFTLLIISLVCRIHSSDVNSVKNADIFKMKQILNTVNKAFQTAYERTEIIKWEYYVNNSETNLKRCLAAEDAFNKLKKSFWHEVQSLQLCHDDCDCLLQVKLLKEFIYYAVLPDKESQEFTRLIYGMNYDYANIRLPALYQQKGEMKIADVVQFLASSKDPTKLAKVWFTWHQEMPQFRQRFTRSVELLNEVARIKKFKNAAEMIVDEFKSLDIRRLTKRLWNEVEPLYKEFHAFIRHKLREHYGDVVPERGGIPAHLLGNIYGINWQSLKPILFPNPADFHPKINHLLKIQKYTPHSMCLVADDFMESLGFEPLPSSFYKNFYLETDIAEPEIVYVNSSDIRVATQMDVSYGSFIQAHWIVFTAHLYRLAAHETFIYNFVRPLHWLQGLFNPLLYCVTTKKHFLKFGLLEPDDLLFTDSKIVSDQEINTLLLNALNTLVFLPYACAFEEWKWDVYSGETKPENYNCAWWKLRFEYQGIEPPMNRSEEHFDAASKKHLFSDISYLIHFLDTILTFQIHRTICIESGGLSNQRSSKFFHDCDVYGSVDAGNSYRDILKYGRSQDTFKFLEVFTGMSNISAESLLLYFEPLWRWMEAYNKKNGVYVGWENPRNRCF